MKRPTLELWERQERLARDSLRRRQKRMGVRRGPRESWYVQPGELLRAPQHIDITRGSGKELAKFLRALATTVLDLRTPVRLDFSRTESFYPAGAILLFAEVDRIVTLSDLPKPITIIEPVQRRPREVLKQIGFHLITGDSSDVVPERDDVVYWKATKGLDQSGDKLAILEVVAERVNQEETKQVALKGLWRGVSEAVGNSCEHAYKKPRRDGFQGLSDTRWWMFTQLRNSLFTVAVCDLGCGYRETIGETLPEKFVAALTTSLGGGNRDSLAIHTAMEYGRSGTHQSERGKGSRDAMSVLERHGAGELMILSNSGWMHYEFSGGKQRKMSHGDVGIDMRGTVVWWKLPLSEGEA